MSNLIVDTSVIIKWLNSENEDLLAQANNILLDAQTGKVILFAPQLSRYEIGNALLKKKLDLALAQDALGTAYRLPVNFVPETPQLAFETDLFMLRGPLLTWIFDITSGFVLDEPPKNPNPEFAAEEVFELPLLEFELDETATLLDGPTLIENVCIAGELV